MYTIQQNIRKILGYFRIEKRKALINKGFNGGNSCFNSYLYTIILHFCIADCYFALFIVAGKYCHRAAIVPSSCVVDLSSHCHRAVIVRG